VAIEVVSPDGMAQADQPPAPQTPAPDASTPEGSGGTEGERDEALANPDEQGGRVPDAEPPRGIGSEIAEPLTSVGACYTGDQLLLVGGSTVDCDSPHIGEVFAVTLLSDPAGAPLPSEEALQMQASDYCNDALAEVTGVAGQTSAIPVRFFRPTPESWIQGDREIACFVEYPEPTDRPLSDIDPLRDLGLVSVYALAPGDCVANETLADVVSLDLVDCVQPHWYEAFATTSLDGDNFPGDDAVEDVAGGYCQGQFATYSSSDDSSLLLESAGPTEFTWTELGDRLLVCLVTSSSERTGSVADG